MRRGLPVLVVGALALVPQVALAAGVDPQKRLTAVDTHLAASVLLSRGELGAASWQALSGSNAGSAACGILRNLQPNESNLVETGSAVGPLFSNSGYEALTQDVNVFASVDQASQAWTRTVNKNLVVCMEQQLENTSTMGAAVSVTDWSRLKLPKLSVHTAAFRVTATATTGAGKHPKVYLDVLVLSHGRALTKLTLSSLKSPFPTGYEARLATLVASKIAHS